MRKLSTVVVVLVLIAAACSGSGSGAVGSTGDVTITEADVGALFESDSLPIDQTLRDSIFALLARQVLIDGLKDDFGLDLDEDEVDTVEAEMVAQLESLGVSPGELLGIPDAGLAMVRFNAEIGAIRQQVIDARLALDETVEAFFAEAASFTTVCARHILLDSEEEAAVVRERLASGEDFAEVADEVSLDPGSPGGDLGCALANRYVPEFAAATMTAEIGELTDPVATSFGFHVIVVDDRTAPSEDEFRADPSAYVSAEQLDAIFGEWLTEKLAAAVVTVEAKYGVWTPRGILPPTGEE